MATRIGVDIGGTFTDLVFYDADSAQTLEGKVPTVPHAPEQGVIEAIRRFVPPAVIEKAEFFIHGTTVGLNALLERQGAKLGMICTAGFRDVLEIRRGDRAEMYNLFWKQPPALVPRHLRLEIEERMLADGTVYRPLDEAAVAGLVLQLQREAVDSIAVCLLNSYSNPAHELRIEDLLRDAGFTGGISLSHRVSGEYREYERFSTTVIDAFVRTRMSSYLIRLEQQLRELGFAGQCLITRSGSGSMSFAEAEDRPFETIMSGPVGGAHGASEIARAIGASSVITADVGGTSFDTALILDGEVQILFEGVIAGMPIQTPWVDVRSIGAGGGSIAYKDMGGLMRVGPRSAQAVPGPACYGKGGVEPTTTDAAAYLGMLGPGRLASGINLDFGKAQTAIGTVASSIGQDIQATAVGIMRIASASMANAMREITVEQGLDPRAMTLLPIGGAGPMFATMLADELQMDTVVIPPLAGNFSAWGLLGADMLQSASRTRIIRLSDEGIGEVNGILEELYSRIGARRPAGSIMPQRYAKLDLRYAGQEYGPSISVPLEDGRLAIDAEAIRGLFEEDFLRTYGSILNFPIEVVVVRAFSKLTLPERAWHARPPGKGETGTWKAYSFRRGKMMDFAVADRAAVTDISGPVIITESTTTLYVDEAWRVQRGSQGELVLSRMEA